MSNKQNKLIKELISKLEKDGVDVSKYTQELENINKNLKDKKYGLVWEQHTEPLIEELKSKIVELQEVKERRIYKGEEYTNNFLIEGDNLESLNALLKSGLVGKVDVITIDPPYNIFINKKKSGKLTYEDKRVNLEDSYPHSMWISFMKERLKLSKKLMSNEGVIFINIDETEVYNLKLLCDDVFGEDNFIGNIVWESKNGGGNDSRLLNDVKEYILVYCKNVNNVVLTKKVLDVGSDSKYKYEDKYVEIRGRYLLKKLDGASLRYLGSLDFPIEDFDGNVAIPGGSLEENNKKVWSWRWSKDKVEWGLREGFIVVKKDSKGVMCAYSKQYQYVDNKGNLVDRTIPHRTIINDIKTIESDKEIKDLFGSKVFDYPKPVSLIKHLISLHPKKDAIVCDYFAGSGSLGHACLELNKEDGGNRRFILCTNNENNICEDITYQRLNKVINGYTTPKGKEVEGITANLTYLKTNLINKEDDYIMYDNNHLEYIINLLKLKYGITNEEDLNNSEDVENKLIKLLTESQDIYIYLNDYIDEEDFNKLELGKEKENIVYVDESLVNDKYLLLKGFKNINSVNNYFK